ncbi:hypothetical protein [Prochlorococcus marinus]|uniref:hypothetical protein n=1 Tax=Prochlorococcus marinus TaxID=1219 RepID=UPI0022B3ACEA|nr:hypothetical protein [Prochlorococcus marinus]
MFISDLCSTSVSAEKRRNNFHKRKLEVLLFYKDSLERRLAALSASIDKLQEQISRDDIELAN